MGAFAQPFDTGRDVAVVTGAGNGIGRAIALALVGEGVRTVFADINPDTVGTAVAAAATPALALAWTGDLAQRAECDRLLADARGRFGPRSPAFGPRRRAAAPRSRQPDCGRRRHLGHHAPGQCQRRFSSWARSGACSDGCQSARQPALPHFTSCRDAAQPAALQQREGGDGDAGQGTRRKSLGQFGIRVNALVPGAVAAGGFVADPALARHIPLGRLGRADDLAALALAILSDRISGYVTGSSIVIDGGLSLTNWFDAPAREDLL